MDLHSSPIRRAAGIFAIALALTACTTTRPFPVTPSQTMVHEVQGEDAPMTAAPTDKSAPRPTVVAVCYNGMVNTDADVWAEAALACPAGKLTLRDDDVLWTRCPLLQPQRANFICVPAKPPEAPAPAQ
jgi:hypothetical protein